jgi:hypothetical protein
MVIPAVVVGYPEPNIPSPLSPPTVVPVHLCAILFCDVQKSELISYQLEPVREPHCDGVSRLRVLCCQFILEYCPPGGHRYALHIRVAICVSKDDLSPLQNCNTMTVLFPSNASFHVASLPSPQSALTEMFKNSLMYMLKNIYVRNGLGNQCAPAFAQEPWYPTKRLGLSAIGSSTNWSGHMRVRHGSVY